MKKQFTELIGVFSALVFLILLTPNNLSAQCAAGEAEYTLSVYDNGTSGFPQEKRVVLIPANGDPEVELIGCDEYPTSDPGTYVDFPFCVTVGEDYTLEFQDDWGDGWNLGFIGVDPIWTVSNGPVEVGSGANPTNAAAGDGSTDCAGWDVESTFSFTAAATPTCEVPDIDFDVVENCETNTYDIEGTINSYGVNDAGVPVFLLDVLRETDNPDFELDNIVIPGGLVGQTVDFATDVPFGTTVTLTPAVGFESICNIPVVLTNENICPPPNDECSEALVAECGEEYSGNTENAAELPEALVGTTCGTSINGGGVWYEFTAPFNVIVTANTFGSDYDTKLFAFSSEDCVAFDCIAGNDDSGSLQSQVEFNLVAGESVYFLVSGFFGATGDYTFTVNCEELLCTDPTLAFEAQDLEGNPLGDCQDVGEQYQLAITLSDVPADDPNTDYTVSAGGESEPLAVIDQTVVLGPFDAGNNVTINAVGNQDDNCGVSADVVSEICPPVNDECADALPLACGDNVTGSTTGALRWDEANPDQPFCGTTPPSTFGDGNGGVWYELEIAELSVVDLDLSGSEYDTKIFLYSGTCEELVCIDGDDDGGTGLDSQLEANLEAGTYYVFVTGFGTSDGVYTLNVTCTPILCENPEVVLTTVDAQGNPILEDCLPIEGEFFVELDFTPAEGNATYTASIDGDTETLEGATVNTYGPFTPTTVVDVVITGDDDANCGFTGSATVDACPPPNATCADAIALNCNETIIGTNIGADVIADELSCTTFGDAGPSVWYTLTVENDAEIFLNTCLPGTTFDTDLTVYEGTCEELVCSSDFPNGDGGGWIDGPFGCDQAASSFAAQAGFSATGGVTYYVRVSGYFGTATGAFELQVTCQDVECSPAVTATAVADAEGNPIDGCIDFGSDYFVSVELEGGSGNDFYTASIDGVGSVEIEADGSGILGPVSVGTDAEVLVVGNTNDLCSGSASVASPDVCPPSNDLPCDAIPIVADGSTGSYTSLNATSDEGEPILALLGGSTVWFSVVAPESGRLNVSTCGEGTEFDTTLGLFEVEDCGDYTTYTEVAFNDESPDCDDFGPSILETCVTPGETYFIQVDGFFGASGTFDLTASEEDGAICDCVLPDLGPDVFTFAETFPICTDEGESFGLTFFGPDDIGSQDGMFYTYDWPGNPNPDPIELLVGAGEEVTVPETFDLGVVVAVTVTINEECEEADGSIYPLSGNVVQDEFACEPDCEGTPGGDVGPGSACTTDDDQPGVYDDDCVCQPAPENDNCDGAIEAIVDGDNLQLDNTFASGDPDGTITCGVAGDVAVDNDVWAFFVAPNNAVTLETISGTNGDTQMQVYDACDGAVIGCDDDGGAGFMSLIEFACGELIPGNTYWVQMDGWSAASGTFELSVTSGESCATGATIDGSVDWNSDCGERDATVSVYTAGTATLLNSYAAVVDANGDFSVEISESSGTVDVYVKVDGYLQKVSSGIELIDGANAVDFGAITGGDITGNNEIGIGDYGIFSAAYGSEMGAPAYNPFADLNCDMEIDIADYGPFSASYGTAGDEPAE